MIGGETMKRTLRRVPPRVGISIVGCLVAGVVAAPLVSLASPSDHDHASPRASLATVVEHFALLRSPPNGPAPAAIVAAARRAPAMYGIAVAQARHAADGAWLIPGVYGLCIAVADAEGVGMSCSTTAAAERGELLFAVRDQSSGEEQLTGVAEDGWRSVTALSADGQVVGTAQVVDSSYAMRTRDAVRIQAGGP